MKILHLTPTYVPALHQGGPVLSAHYLHKWLVKYGIDVTVYTTDINGQGRLNVPLNQKIEIDGVKVFYFPFSFPRPWKYSKNLHQALAKNIPDFDLIHITSVFLSASTLGSYYSLKAKKPYVISPRGSLMKEPLRLKSALKKKIYLKLVELKNLEKADAVHFTFEKEKQEYLEAKMSFKKSIVIPNGLDPDEYSEEVPNGFFRKKFNIPEDRKIILFLSRVNWKKGLDTLIPAMKKVSQAKPEAILVIAGNDEEKYLEKVKALAKNNQIRDKIIFTGFLTGKEKIAAFKDSNLFILPSYSENFGMAVAEALYLGAPVIITPGVALSSEIQKSGAGLVVEKNENSLALAILELLNNRVKSEELAKRGRVLVENQFLIPNITKQFIAAYADLLKNET